jgi:3-hydroxybutyryl-CoA dehydrogenase
MNDQRHGKKANEVDEVGCVVIGGGTMGAGIAQIILSETSSRVYVVDPDATARDRCRVTIESGLQRRFAKEDDARRLVSAALDRLDLVPGAGDFVAPEIVIEAVPENIDLKTRVLQTAVEHWPQALIATNTSSLSVTELHHRTGASRFVGMHFFNPVPTSRLVEVVCSNDSTAESIEAAQRWVAQLQREAITVKDSPGFATSRLGVAIGLEAMRMVEEGVASANDIDRGMVLGYKFPIGPLELSDRVGLDVRLAIANHLASELGPRFEAPQLLRQMVSDGRVGRKSGAGFYEWENR